MHTRRARADTATFKTHERLARFMSYRHRNLLISAQCLTCSVIVPGAGLGAAAVPRRRTKADVPVPAAPDSGAHAGSAGGHRHPNRCHEPLPHGRVSN